MASVNKVILVGRLGSDVELKNINDSQTVANFSIATSEKWNNKLGEKQEKTEWHRIVMWGKVAEIAGKYLHKGSQVYIEGKLQTRSWDDKDGNKRYATEVVGFSLQMLDGKKQESEQRPAQATQQDETNIANDDSLPF